MDRKTENIVSLLDSRFDEGQKQRTMHLRQWYINLAYLCGYQWLFWNSITRRLELRYQPKNRVRMVSNQILPIFATAVSKLTKNPPQFEASAGTRDVQDILSADVARKVMRHYWIKLNLEDASDTFASWLVATGNAFLHTTWDRNGGRLVDAPLTYDGEAASKFPGLQNPLNGQPYQSGEPMINPETGQPFTVEINEGDLSVEVISPLEIYFPMGTVKADSATWQLRVREFTREQISSIWGEDVAKKIQYEIKEKDAPVERSVFHKLRGVLGSQGEDEQDVQGPKATVMEHWQKPIRANSKGSYIAKAGSQILHMSEFDYRDFGYPIKHCVYYKIPGVVWGRSLITDEIPLQKQYNKRLSQIVEAINEISRPKILLPAGSAVSPLAFTKNAGEKIEYNPLAGEPKYLNTGDLPQSLFADLENIKKDMQQVAGLHEVSHANVPASVRSGVAISFLQDTDDTRLGKITRRSELTWGQSGRIMLHLVKTKVDEPRMGRIMGDDSETEVFMFKGSDIAENVDVHVQAGSAFPQNQMLKQQYIKEMYDSGLIPPDEARRLLQMEGAFRLKKGTLLDMQVAKLENEIMVQTQQMIQPDLFEDMTVHLEQHADWLKANKFSGNPAYILIYQHYMMTFQLYGQTMMAGQGMLPMPQGQEQLPAPGQGQGGEEGAF